MTLTPEMQAAALARYNSPSPTGTSDASDPKPPRRGGIDQFGRFPFWLATGGWLHELRPAELRAYLAIAAHSDRNWRARPSMERIAAICGWQDVETARRAVRRLEAGELLRCLRGGGRGRANEYQLATKPPRTQRGNAAETPAQADGKPPRRARGQQSEQTARRNRSARSVAQNGRKDSEPKQPHEGNPTGSRVMRNTEL